MFYPPKGAANADPEWGPIDFTYVFIISSCVPETYRFKNTNIIRIFEILKMLYCDGWMDGWVDGWVDGDFLPPLIFFIFNYNSKQNALIPKTCLKVAFAY